MKTRRVRIACRIVTILAVACGLAHGVSADLLQSVRFKPVKGREREPIFVPRTEQPPVIDATLTDPCWQAAYRTDRLTWGGGRKGANTTELLLSYDTANLYIGARCGVAKIADLKTLYPAGEENARAWGDDCVDFKLSADNERTTVQFIVTAGGAHYDSRNGDAGVDLTWQRAAKVGAEEYVLEAAIPLAEIGIRTFKPGVPLIFNFGRADRTTRELTALAEPYGDFANAPLLVLGTPEAHQSFLASGAFLRDVEINIAMDRDRYPSFQRLATGRVTLRSGRSGTKLSGKPAVLFSIQQQGKSVRSQRIEPVLSSIVDFDLPLSGLPPGTYEMQIRVADGTEVLEATATREFVVYPMQPERSGRVPIAVPPSPGNLQTPWPLTFGVPFPWGALSSTDNLRLLDAKGHELPVQVRVTGRWSRQGSIRWLLIDCIPPASTASQQLTLVYGPNEQRQPVESALELTESDQEVVVSTGPLRFVVPRGHTPGIAELYMDKNANGTFEPNEVMIRPDDSAGPYMIDEAGTVYRGIADPGAEVVVEASGPIKACVRVSGWHVAETGKKLGKYILRFQAYAGLPYVRVFHTFIITAGSNKTTVGAPDGTPGTEEVRYRDIAYTIPFSSAYYFFGTPKINSGWVKGPDDSAYLLQRDDLLCKTYKNGVFTDECEKAEGWMSVGASNNMMTLALKDFWQQFPKELEVHHDRVTAHFWPAHNEAPIRTGKNLSIRNVYHQWFAHEGLLDFKVPAEVLSHVKTDSERHNWPNAKVINAMGLAKTHEMLLYFHTDDWEKARARTVSRTFQSNPTATCAPEWVCRTKVFGNMLPHDSEHFPKIETAIDENIDCIFRHREMDRDYGMFNFGDSHHNWQWQQRRWDLHRIWRNTHHGWTRWPWLMYARTGRKDLFDWGDRNGRHVADVDHCHYTPEEFLGLPWPRAKLVGGICDYKGFVHWASGARLGYNSAADAMLHHYYFTGDERSRTTALEHGAALVDSRRAYPHREGSGRTTSACALYFATWDNDYLDFLERTVDCLLGTQKEDGSFPQWEDFAPFLQRYVDLTGSRRGEKAMARWADWICAQRVPRKLYGAKISILAHAYLYTGDEKYLRTAAYRVRASVDNQYLGEDPRYRGMFIVGHSNLDQSYFMQWIPYYLAAIAKHGKEPEPDRPDRTWIRTHDRVELGETSRVAWTSQHEAAPKQTYLWRARLKQARDDAFQLHVELRGYKNQRFMTELCPRPEGSRMRTFVANPKHEGSSQINLTVARDGALEYELRIYADNNFFVRVPVTYGRSDLGEVYPLFSGGTVVDGGMRCYFNVPDGAERFTLGYKGRAWPLRAELFAPNGERAAEDTWISSNDPYVLVRRLDGSTTDAGHEGWAFSITGYGPGGLQTFEVQPTTAQRPFFFSLDRSKLFTPSD